MGSECVREGSAHCVLNTVVTSTTIKIKQNTMPLPFCSVAVSMYWNVAIVHIVVYLLRNQRTIDTALRGIDVVVAGGSAFCRAAAVTGQSVCTAWHHYFRDSAEEKRFSGGDCTGGLVVESHFHDKAAGRMLRRRSSESASELLLCRSLLHKLRIGSTTEIPELVRIRIGQKERQQRHRDSCVGKVSRSCSLVGRGLYRDVVVDCGQFHATNVAALRLEAGGGAAGGGAAKGLFLKIRVGGVGHALEGAYKGGCSNREHGGEEGGGWDGPAVFLYPVSHGCIFGREDGKGFGGEGRVLQTFADAARNGSTVAAAAACLFRERICGSELCSDGDSVARRNPTSAPSNGDVTSILAFSALDTYTHGAGRIGSCGTLVRSDEAAERFRLVYDSSDLQREQCISKVRVGIHALGTKGENGAFQVVCAFPRFPGGGGGAREPAIAVAREAAYEAALLHVVWLAKSCDRHVRAFLPLASFWDSELLLAALRKTRHRVTVEVITVVVLAEDARAARRFHRAYLDSVLAVSASESGKSAATGGVSIELGDAQGWEESEGESGSAENDGSDSEFHLI